eukprot:9976529-Ditylum_brightwellii.AAC.1
MTSWYGYLGRVGILGTWVRKLVNGLWKFGSRVFGLVISRSGMLGLGLCHCKYAFWDVTWENASG